MKFNIILELHEDGYLLLIPVIEDVFMVKDEEEGIQKANELIEEYIESLIELNQLKPELALNGKPLKVCSRKVIYTVSI
mgnify:CR=1 FL=1